MEKLSKLFIFSFIFQLLFLSLVFAQNLTNQTALPSVLTPFRGIYNFLVTANPILLLVLGGVLLVVSKFAKWIGIILIIFAIIHFLFLLL